VEALKSRYFHIHFTANFENLGRAARQSQRHIAYGFYIPGDIIALITVSTCSAKSQVPIFITQANGSSVEFEFGKIAEILPVKPLANTAVKLVEFAFVIGIVEAEQRNGVIHRLEIAVGLSANALCGRIGMMQVKLIFKLF